MHEGLFNFLFILECSDVLFTFLRSASVCTTFQENAVCAREFVHRVGRGGEYAAHFSVSPSEHTADHTASRKTVENVDNNREVVHIRL